MQRIMFTLSYEGTNYAGWQIQAAQPVGLPTIQYEIEKALRQLTGAEIRIHGAGRTDAGVHAEGQTAHCDIPEDKIRINWVRAMNCLLPPDIRVLAAKAVAPDFHSRIQAREKVYCYSLWAADEPVPARIRNFCSQTRPLRLAAIQEAANLLIGRRDFASFQNSGTPLESTVRTLHCIRLEPGSIGPLRCPEHWPAVSLFFRGDGFLKQMIRNIAGMLIKAGQGKLTIEDARAILAAADRRQNPCPTAPAHGLTLMRVLYEE